MCSLALAATAPGGEEPDATRRMLFLGMGAGTLPQLLCHHLAAAEVELTAVELDASVVEAARTQLCLSERVDVHVDDAQSWLRRHVASTAPDFDVIFVRPRLLRPPVPPIGPPAARALSCDLSLVTLPPSSTHQLTG